MKVTQIILFPALIAGFVAAQDDCDALDSVVACINNLPSTCDLFTITQADAFSSCNCGYGKALLACQTSFCPPSGPIYTEGLDVVSVYCSGASPATATVDANTARATVNASSGAAATGTGPGITGSAASKSSVGRAEITSIPNQAIVAAVVGLVGALV